MDLDMRKGVSSHNHRTNNTVLYTDFISYHHSLWLELTSKVHEVFRLTKIFLMFTFTELRIASYSNKLSAMYSKGNVTFTVLKILRFMYTVLVSLFCDPHTVPFQWKIHDDLWLKDNWYFILLSFTIFLWQT